MSNYIMLTKRPYGHQQWDFAYWMDDFFGHHHYGVKFSDGVILDADNVKLETQNVPIAPEISSMMEELYFPKGV